jgi:type II secretory ATPase GspE/PulE/Tfp pilus assembly ATPase PilB-like protein
MPALAAPVLLDLLGRAQQEGAEAIHLTPLGTGHAVRFRLDGALVSQPSLCQDDAWSVFTALRRVLDVDGDDEARGDLAIAGHGFASPWRLEVALIPDPAGPAAVLRPVSARRGLGALGIDPADVARLRARLARPGGVFVVNGPQRSGRKTFLAACMAELAADRSVYAVDTQGGFGDVPGVVHLTPDHELGYFPDRLVEVALADGDPDVLVVDRIHSPFTLERAFDYANSVTTLFGFGCCDAATTVRYLSDMGLEPWRVAAALAGVVSLARLPRLCPVCRVAEPAPSRESLRRLAPRLVTDELVEGWEVGYRPGTGCAACRRGVAGHVFLAEVCLLEPKATREWVALDDAARRERLRERVLTLRERALLRAAAGEVGVAQAVAGTPAWTPSR